MNTVRSFTPLQAKDIIGGTDLARHELETVLATAALLKRDYRPFGDQFAGRSMVMLFEKPSLRTRLTFEIGFAKLGGHAVYVDQQSARIGQRESISDCARNLDRWTDVIVARTFSHATIEELAEHSSVPVVNALSDRFHPCQALADVLTIAEQFPDRVWSELSLAYIGDGNNVCHSLALAAAILGVKMTIITPKGYEPATDIIKQARQLAKQSGATITVTHDLDAVAQHDVIYTDTWVSMGSESEAAKRLADLAPYQVTSRIMNAAGPNAIFMHCLPAYRGKEVAADVIDGPRSVVFDQAENRMHAQCGLLLHLLQNTKSGVEAEPVWPDMIGAAPLA